MTETHQLCCVQSPTDHNASSSKKYLAMVQSKEEVYESRQWENPDASQDLVI